MTIQSVTGELPTAKCVSAATFDELLGGGPDSHNAVAARDLARRGFAVFPIRDWGDGDGWKPISQWPERATGDVAQIDAWWQRWPDAQVGLPAGERNGISVLDVDSKNGKDGVASLSNLGFGDLSALSPVRVRTPSGGWHLFFKYDKRLKNSASLIADGVDVRTERGFVVAPGSEKGGVAYEAIGAVLGEVPLPAFPDTLIPAAKTELPAAQIIAEAAANQIEWAEHHLSEIANRLAQAEEGMRNDTLNAAAMWASGAAVHGLIDEGVAKAALFAAAEAIGLGKREFQSTFKSGWKAGQKHPISTIPPPITAESFDELPPLDIDLLGGKSEPPTQLRFLSPGDCADAPSRGYVLKGFIAPGDVGCIFGAPGAGKSLISPHIGYAVAQGRAAFGMRTKQGRTFYVAAEDPHGMRGRVAALKLRHGDAPEFFIVEGVSDLLSKGSRDFAALYQAVAEQSPSVIFIDTLAMAFPGLEENSADEMGRVVHVARKLAESGAAVVLIHHDTKAQGATPRGHSLLNGALDVALHLFPKDESGIVRGKLTKNRNGSCDRDIAFRIAVEGMGEDEDGDAITFALVDELAPGTAPRAIKLSGSERAAFDVARKLAASGHSSTENEWREACINGRSVSPSEDRDNRKRAFNRAAAGLVRKEALSVLGGIVQLPGLPLSGDAFDDDGEGGGT